MGELATPLHFCFLCCITYQKIQYYFHWYYKYCNYQRPSVGHCSGPSLLQVLLT